MFHAKSQLRNHVSNMHLDNEKLFRCDICDKDFRFARKLKSHFFAVHDRKKFKCQVCSKTFTMIANLKKHDLEVHAKLKPYECDKCCSTFKRKQHLESHIQIIHNQQHYIHEVFNCDICEKHFSHQRSLVVHAKSAHGIGS